MRMRGLIFIQTGWDPTTYSHSAYQWVGFFVSSQANQAKSEASPYKNLLEGDAIERIGQYHVTIDGVCKGKDKGVI
jgi:hypothetical protein